MWWRRRRFHNIGVRRIVAEHYSQGGNVTESPHTKPRVRRCLALQPMLAWRPMGAG